MRRQIPWPLRIALAVLAISVLACMVAGLKGNPRALIGGVVNAALAVGLYLGHRWAYVLTLLGTVVTFFVMIAVQGLAKALAILAVNALVLVPVVLCTSYFLFGDAAAQSPRDQRSDSAV